MSTTNPNETKQTAAVSDSKAARGEEAVPPWKLPNYTGPMTIQYAEFRNARYTIKDGKVVPREGYEIDPKTGIAVQSKPKKTAD